MFSRPFCIKNISKLYGLVWQTAEAVPCNSRSNSIMSHRTSVEKMYKSAIQSVSPGSLLQDTVRVNNDGLIQIRNTVISKEKTISVVGFGKAVLGMVAELDRILHHRIKGGVAVVPTNIKTQLLQHGLGDMIPAPDCNIAIHEGAHLNIPDENCMKGSDKIYNLVSELGADDLLITLISGGGSALLCLPRPPITLPDVINLTKLLSRRGASIHQLNTVRKHIEILKGGGLSTLAYPAQVVGLILSDVVGDPIDFIASGPTIKDATTPQHAQIIIDKYLQHDEIPDSVRQVLSQQSDKSHRDNYINYIIGSNYISLVTASQTARSLGYQPLILSSTITGTAEQAAIDFSVLTNRLLNSADSTDYISDLFLSAKLQPSDLNNQLSDWSDINRQLSDWSKTRSRPLVILAGGETTVNVTGNGRGGRNQHMVLKMLLELNKISNIRESSVIFASVGTDGQDGPTDAAGALIDTSTLVSSSESAEKYLFDNNSYQYFTRNDTHGCLIKTGLTGTNVMDLQFLVIPN